MTRAAARAGKDALPAPGLPRVLVVSHEASRSGAPRVAVLVVRALAERGLATSIVSLADGPLVRDFRALARTLVEPLWRWRNRLRQVEGLGLLSFAVDSAAALSVLVRWPSDVVYVNSTAAAVYLRPARWLGRRTILHVHESFDVAAAFLRRARADDLSGVELIACSPSVESDLQRLTSRAPVLVHSVPDDRGAESARAQAAETGPGHEPGPLVVGACGVAGHRKGTDLWVEIARRVLANQPQPDPRFVWVGEHDQRDFPGLPPQVTFAGPTPDAFAAMATFDVAVMTSRDDPFPLVVLEAMLMGVPVVAFDVGGVREQIGDTGILVSPGDLDGFAAAVSALLGDCGLRAELGAAARARAEALYSTASFSAKVLEVVEGGP